MASAAHKSVRRRTNHEATEAPDHQCWHVTFTFEFDDFTPLRKMLAAIGTVDDLLPPINTVFELAQHSFWNSAAPAAAAAE
jgi:hypothetical protein